MLSAQPIPSGHRQQWVGVWKRCRGVSVSVCLHLWKLGKRKNAVCVGVCCVGVACQSWFAGASVPACGAAFAAAVMLQVHTWLCMSVPVSAPCPCPGVCECVCSGAMGTRVHVRAWASLTGAAALDVPRHMWPSCDSNGVAGCPYMCNAAPPYNAVGGCMVPSLGSHTPPAPGPQLQRCWCLARPRLTLLEPTGTVRGSFNLMKCEAFYGLLITW